MRTNAGKNCKAPNCWVIDILNKQAESSKKRGDTYGYIKAASYCKYLENQSIFAVEFARQITSPSTNGYKGTNLLKVITAVNNSSATYIEQLIQQSAF